MRIILRQWHVFHNVLTCLKQVSLFVAPYSSRPCDNDLPLLEFSGQMRVDTLEPRQNGRQFTDDIFKCIFLNENAWILLKISLKFVPKLRINNIPSLVQIMAWRRPSAKPFSEPMRVNLLTHICVIRPQCPQMRDLTGICCGTVLTKSVIINLYASSDMAHVVFNCRLCSFLDGLVNTLRPTQNDRHFADDTFNRLSVNENVRISIKFSLKFVPKGQINNIPALVQIMAWRRPGDKPLSEPVMVSLLTHICVTRPQWVKDMV